VQNSLPVAYLASCYPNGTPLPCNAVIAGLNEQQHIDPSGSPLDLHRAFVCRLDLVARPKAVVLLRVNITAGHAKSTEVIP